MSSVTVSPSVTTESLTKGAMSLPQRRGMEPYRLVKDGVYSEPIPQVQTIGPLPKVCHELHEYHMSLSGVIGPLDEAMSYKDLTKLEEFFDSVETDDCHIVHELHVKYSALTMPTRTCVLF